MLRRDELLAYLDELLDVRRYDDYAPNGLQVEGAEVVRTVVSGVTASRALVEAAVRAGADALLVHHGYFWRGEDPRVVGRKRARIAPLLAMYSELTVPMTAEDCACHIEGALGRVPLFVSGGERTIRRVGWCTGAAQKHIDAAAAQGLDAYITGEVSEHTVHVARELGIHFFAAGHHATERYGVAALGDHLAQRFGVKHLHLDLANPA